MRVEPCACGGSISAESLAASAPAVARHNASPRHQRWRAEGGFTPHNAAHELLLTGLALSQEMQPGETSLPVEYPQRSVLLRR